MSILNKFGTWTREQFDDFIVKRGRYLRACGIVYQHPGKVRIYRGKRFDASHEPRPEDGYRDYEEIAKTGMIQSVPCPSYATSS